MHVTKRSKPNDKIQVYSPATSNKLFVDYPYPMLTELEKQCKQEPKRSNHSYTLAYLRRYKDHLNKMLSTFNGLQNRNTSTFMLKESIRSENVNGYSSKKSVVNNLHEQVKSIRNHQLQVRSMTSIVDDNNGQNNEQHVCEREPMGNLDDHIDNHQG